MRVLSYLFPWLEKKGPPPDFRTHRVLARLEMVTDRFEAAAERIEARLEDRTD